MDANSPFGAEAREWAWETYLETRRTREDDPDADQEPHPLDAETGVYTERRGDARDRTDDAFDFGNTFGVGDRVPDTRAAGFDFGAEDSLATELARLGVEENELVPTPEALPDVAARAPEPPPLDALAAAIGAAEESEPPRAARVPLVDYIHNRRVSAAIAALAEREAFNIDDEDVDGHTALCEACMRMNTPAVLVIVECLGADVNLRDQRGKFPLEIAASKASVDIARCLIRNGADVSERTTLVAAACGNVDFIRWLVRSGEAQVPLVPCGLDLKKRTVELSMYFLSVPFREWERRVSTGTDFVLAVQNAGSYAKYVAEPRYSLVLLRILCESNRASLAPADETPTLFRDDATGRRASVVAARLFGIREESAIPLDCFALVLQFWWGG